jgi:diguanylate cyclase (GGDEF)-like protein
MSAVIAGFLWVVAMVTFSTTVATLLSIYFGISYAIFFIVNNTSKLAELPLNGGIFIVFVLVIIPMVHTIRYKDMRNIFILKCEVEGRRLEIIEKQEELEYQATYDALTGAFTRRSGLKKLEDRITLSIREKTYLTLVYLDIDNLKITNDKLGHNEGDRLIKAISSSITNIIRNSDIFCRVGGDEFIIVFYDCRMEQVKSVMKRVEEDLAHKSNNYPFPLEMSTGIVEHDFLRNEDSDSLIERADKVMYEVKRKRKKSEICNAY